MRPQKLKIRTDSISIPHLRFFCADTIFVVSLHISTVWQNIGQISHKTVFIPLQSAICGNTSKYAAPPPMKNQFLFADFSARISFASLDMLSFAMLDIGYIFEART